MFKHFSTILFALCLSISTYALTLSDEARIFVLSCTPGDAIYERYGHTSIRVVDPKYDMDEVYNYGVFTFNIDHFYWKFIKGETWYRLEKEPSQYFLWDYLHENRPVYIQELALSVEQRQIVFDALQVNLMPKNKSYLYNFVFDNCATRPYHLIKDALQDTIQSTYHGYEGHTYREFISHYTGKGSWVDFGINLLFGSKADCPMYGEQRIFLPEELMFYISEAKLSNQQALTSRQHIAPFPVRHTPWWQTYYFGLALLTLLIALISWYDRGRKRCTWWIDILLICMYILLLALVAFLTFCSLHPLVGFGWRLLIIPILHLCARLIYIIH